MEANIRTDLEWFIVRTKPRADHLAADELRSAGFEVYSPRVKTPQRGVGYQYEPLFPGYVFVRCASEGGQSPSRVDFPHTLGWVSFDGTIPSIPDAVIHLIAAKVEALNCEGGIWRRFRPGDRVRVVADSVESLAQVVEEVRSPRSRVRVLMQFMGRLVSAQVPWDALQPVEEPPHQSSPPPRRTRGRGRWIHGFGAHPVGSP